MPLLTEFHSPRVSNNVNLNQITKVLRSRNSQDFTNMTGKIKEILSPKKHHYDLPLNNIDFYNNQEIDEIADRLLQQRNNRRFCSIHNESLGKAKKYFQDRYVPKSPTKSDLPIFSKPVKRKVKYLSLPEIHDEFVEDIKKDVYTEDAIDLKAGVDELIEWNSRNPGSKIKLDDDARSSTSPTRIRNKENQNKIESFSEFSSPKRKDERKRKPSIPSLEFYSPTSRNKLLNLPPIRLAMRRNL